MTAPKLAHLIHRLTEPTLDALEARGHAREARGMGRRNSRTYRAVYWLDDLACGFA